MSPSINPEQITGGLMMAAFRNPPTAFPRISIGGKPFEMRFSLASTFFLETSNQLGDEPFHEWLARAYKTNKLTSMALIVSGAMLGREVDGKWKPMPVKGVDLATRITHAELEVITAAYAEALGKVTEALRAAIQRLQETKEPTPPTPNPDALAN